MSDHNRDNLSELLTTVLLIAAVSTVIIIITNPKSWDAPAVVAPELSILAHGRGVSSCGGRKHQSDFMVHLVTEM